MKQPCKECDGKGRDFDPAHGSSKRCATCNGEGTVEVAEAPKTSETKSIATIDDFGKIDFRVGRVLEAESVPKSKLIRMKVSFGTFERQILAGIGKSFAPEGLVGKQYVFVVNFAPRLMKGLESAGMMLATGPDDEHLSLVSLNGEVSDGSSVG